MNKQYEVFQIDGFDEKLKINQRALRELGLTQVNFAETVQHILHLIQTDPIQAIENILLAAMSGYYIHSVTEQEYDEHWKPSRYKLEKFTAEITAEQSKEIFDRFLFDATGNTPEQLDEIAKKQQQLAGAVEPTKKKKPGNRS